MCSREDKATHIARTPAVKCVGIFVIIILLHFSFRRCSATIQFCHKRYRIDHRLNASVLRNIYAMSELDCVVTCVTDPCCRSVNYKKTAFDEKNCEILHDELQDRNLNHNSDYDYLILRQPYKPFLCTCVACKNNGVCKNNDNTCDCAFGFGGKQCEKEVKYSLVFPRLVSNYVILSGGPSMTEITTCLWVKTTEKNIEQTFVSYSVLGGIDEYAVSIGPSNVLDIMVNEVWNAGDTRDPVQITDGKWHALCFTWENQNGIAQFFVDGLMHAGVNLEKGFTIREEGYWVLGQEQDAVGSGFNVNQMFVGEITNVNIWNRVLKFEEIQNFSFNCTSSMKGNAREWNDFLEPSGLKGNVHVRTNELSFC